jgi:predicted MFS family arabinose efflux permease
MGAGGPGSLAFGGLYDRFGLVVLVPLTIVTAFYAPLALLRDFSPALIGVLLWGIGLGTHEPIMSASTADMVPPENLAAAYGIFTAVFDVASFAGSVALGGPYDLSIGAATILRGSGNSPCSGGHERYR